jgi:hypothetical protein
MLVSDFKIFLCIGLIASFATTVPAEMPEAIKGTWVIDAEASEAQMKTSPKWKAEDAQYLPRIMERMALVRYLFEGDTITVSMRGKEQPMPVTLKTSNEKKWIFEGQAGEQTVTLTVSLNDQGCMNIKSSATDDMDYYLWKRGNPEPAAEE